MSKLKTPDWILKGGKEPKKKKVSGKTFKIRRCPKCNSDDISVVLGFDEGKGKGEWECKKCKWVGKDVKYVVVSEEEFMKYLDNKGEEVI